MILLCGVIFFFGLLTFLILQREKGIILDIYKEKSLQTADIITDHLTITMREANPQRIIDHVKEFNKTEEVKVGVVGPKGLPAFKTDITVPHEIFAAQKETHIKTDGELIFFKPLWNEKRCHSCHNPEDKTRGMIVIKTSIKKAQIEINETARRLVFLAIVIGIISEIFLVVILRKMVLKPVETLSKGAEILKTGKLNHRIEIKRADEIGTLASCFNEMAESIERSHANLENAVRQKTNEMRIVAELSTEVFKGDLTLEGIIEQFLSAITNQMGYDYSALCLIDKETGLLMQIFQKGIGDLCNIEISVASDHLFSKTIREAMPKVKKSVDVNLPDISGNVAIIPILSHQRKRCREINLCTFESCPAFNSPDERCWLINDTLCRSPHALHGKEKIYGCLHCDVFPVLGVLISGRKEDITKTSLHSLEILASEIASAIENQSLIDSKKEDIKSLIKLHDVSVEAIQSLNIQTLTKSVVSSATVFANMDAAILWRKGWDERLYLEEITENIKNDLIPKSLLINESFVGRALTAGVLIETIRTEDVKCLRDIIGRYGFLYVASIPLKFKDTEYGCLTLLKKKDFFMSDSEKAIIQLFATQSAAAVNAAQLYNELKIQKEFSDTIFNDLSMGIMVLDNEQRIVKLNPAGFEILKIKDYIIGNKLLEILPETYDFLVLDHSLGREIEITIEGNTIPIGFSNSPLLGISRERTGSVVVFRDLTEIKKLQAEIRRKHHFETMGKVIAGVAHEIRNPLFGISSIVQILEREVQTEQHHILLQAMLKEIQRLKNLLEELLLYSRPSRLNISEIDLNALIVNIQQYINAKKDDIIFNPMIQPSVKFKADIDKLTQVFLNLIDNAIGAGSKKIDLAIEEKDNTIVTIIKDNGIGIKKNSMDKIFDPFYTTKKEGTGLGLSICKKIIEDHGGEIQIQSSEGNGTTVVLTFKT